MGNAVKALEVFAGVAIGVGVYRSHAGVEVAATTVAIVPAARASQLVAGAVVPVRYLLDQPQVVSLDWG